MSPTLVFILALLCTLSGFEADVEIDKDAVRRMQEREEFLHREMTRLLQEVEDNNSILESLLLSAWQLLWMPWFTKSGQKANEETERREAERMREREEFLNKEMTRLLKEIDDNNSIVEIPFLSAWQLMWGLLLTNAVLFSLAYLLVRRWNRGPASCRMQEGSSNRWNVVRELFSSKDKGLPSTNVLQNLVSKLLGVCRVLSWRSFMPELHPAVGTDTSPAACGVQENSSTYRTPVIQRPTPRHSFS